MIESVNEVHATSCRWFTCGWAHFWVEVNSIHRKSISTCDYCKSFRRSWSTRSLVFSKRSSRKCLREKNQSIQRLTPWQHHHRVHRSLIRRNNLMNPMRQRSSRSRISVRVCVDSAISECYSKSTVRPICKHFFQRLKTNRKSRFTSRIKRSTDSMNSRMFSRNSRRMIHWFSMRFTRLNSNLISAISAMKAHRRSHAFFPTCLRFALKA